MVGPSVSRDIPWLSVLLALAVAACSHVREEDLQAWQNAPVSYLDEHPVFLTMQMVKTITPEGTEIRNYVNGGIAASCMGGGFGSGNATATGMSGMANVMASESFSSFQNCIQRKAAWNNIFYIKNGHVIAYTPVGSGGMRCYTDQRLQPGFRGATNII